MIETQGLTRRFGDFTAVEGVSFTVQEGEIVGLLGPNGAGKSTTIRMITGFLPPTAGSISVAGCDLETDPMGARRQVGYLPENVALYPEMRVSEYLAYRARLEGLGRRESRRRIGETVESCFLEEVLGQIIGTLSRGFRQRVGLAAAIVHGPSVLVLDEPTVGLDPKQIVAIRELIRELGRRQTLLLSSHVLPEVELLCDRVIVVDGGRIVAEGAPETLRRSWRGSTVLRVELKTPAPEAEGVLGGLPGVVSVTQAGDGPNRWRVECGEASDPREEVFRAAVDRGWVLLELAEERASLEEVFVRLTTRESEAAPSRGLLAILDRELRAYFFSPLAYIVAALLLLVNGLVFWLIVSYLNDTRSMVGAPLELFFGQTVFFWLVLLFTTPVLTMRLLAEERGSGTIEVLMTAPVGEAQVVVGKFLAALAFYVFLWLPTLTYAVVLAFHSRVDWGPVASGYLGIVGIGSVFLSIGMLASALTRSQLVAAILTFAMLIPLFTFGLLGNLFVSDVARQALGYLDLWQQMEELGRGVVDTRRLVYYLSTTVLFLFFATRALKRRKWR